jgi:saccharopine dehydrogenase-like NADP-dependent oxidoreductase
MRVLIVGAGGVGAAVAAIARRRAFIEQLTLADVDERRAAGVAARMGDDRRFASARVDASDEAQLAELIDAVDADAVLNATDPRFNEPIFNACFVTGTTYLDMAMTLSRPHPERPYEEPGVKLGDVQFARSREWEQAGLLALVGIGVEPGLSDVLARYAADHLFDEIDEIGVRDGADLVIEGYDFAPTFSIWTTIEECLNPPLVWERDRGWYTTAPFSEPERFAFPEGIGEIECVNVEHEEVVLIPRWVDCRRVTFKYGLGDEFIDVLKTLHKLGLDSTEPVDVRGAEGGPARRRRRDAAGPRDAGRADARAHVRGHLRHRHRQGRPASGDLPLPRRRQRAHDARGRRPGRRLADHDQPPDRPRAHRRGHVERRRRPRPGGLRRRAVPRSAGRPRRAPWCG